MSARLIAEALEGPERVYALLPVEAPLLANLYPMCMPALNETRRAGLNDWDVAVLKVQLTKARLCPPASRMDELKATRYACPSWSQWLGRSVACLAVASYVTVADRMPPVTASRRTKVEPDTPRTDSLKRTETEVAGDTPIAPEPGDRHVMVGAELAASADVPEQVFTKTMTEYVPPELETDQLPPATL